MGVVRFSIVVKGCFELGTLEQIYLGDPEIVSRRVGDKSEHTHGVRDEPTGMKRTVHTGKGTRQSDVYADSLDFPQGVITDLSMAIDVESIVDAARP